MYIQKTVNAIYYQQVICYVPPPGNLSWDSFQDFRVYDDDFQIFSVSLMKLGCHVI